MNFLIEILISLVLGIYSSVGFNFYSKLIEKTRRDFIRIPIFTFAGGLFIILPTFIFLYIFQLEYFETTSNQHFIAIMIWLTFIWVYIIFNWKTLQKRLSIQRY